MREPVPEDGRSSDKDEVERPQNQRLERVTVLVIEQKIIHFAASAARHKNIPSERDSGVLIPYRGTRSVVVEVLVLSVRHEEGSPDHGLRQAPGPLRRCISASFQFSSVRHFHVFMIAHRLACVV